MSSTSLISLDGLSSLIATAQAPVLIERCARRTGLATKPSHVRPTLLTLTIHLGMISFDAQAAETFRMRRDAEDRHPIAGIVENPTDPSTAAMNK